MDTFRRHFCHILVVELHIEEFKKQFGNLKQQRRKVFRIFHDFKRMGFLLLYSTLGHGGCTHRCTRPCFILELAPTPGVHQAFLLLRKGPTFFLHPNNNRHISCARNMQEQTNQSEIKGKNYFLNLSYALLPEPKNSCGQNRPLHLMKIEPNLYL